MASEPEDKPMPTHYEILGVDKHATKEEIRRAYRSAARAIHPDTNPSHDATEKFAALSHAYHVLADTKSRRAYDKQLEGIRSASRGLGGEATGQAHYSWTNIASDATPAGGAGSLGERDFDEMYEAYFGKVKKTRPREG